MKHPNTQLKEALDAAARLAVENGLGLDAFIPAAWAAFMDHNPELREQLERERMLAEIAELRERGLVGQA